MCSADLDITKESFNNGLNLIFSGLFFFISIFFFLIISLGINTKSNLFTWDMIVIVGNYAFDSFPGKNKLVFQYI